MSQVKEWGLKIAWRLFQDKIDPEQVIKEECERTKEDPVVIRSWVFSIFRHPETWGFDSKSRLN